jgi:hypothetical protein
MDSWIFKVLFQGSKLITLKSSLYHWKVIEAKMSKMGLHFPFKHFKHKLWPKERPLKVRNRPDFLACRGCVTYHWKALNDGYNFASDLIAIGGLHTKVCAPKFVGILVVGISKFPLKNPEIKSHLDVAPVEGCKVYYKGEGGGFPQVWAVAHPSTKSVPTMH